MQTIEIGQKTALERQLVGTFEPLTEEELLASSVRAAAGRDAAGGDDVQGRAIAARRRQLFNRDDVDELKRAGCLGESRSAEIVARACDEARAGNVQSLRERLIEEERADRAALIDWVIGRDPSLTTADRPRIVELYRRLRLEQAQPGEWIEADDGTWRQAPGKAPEVKK